MVLFRFQPLKNKGVLHSHINTPCRATKTKNCSSRIYIWKKISCKIRLRRSRSLYLHANAVQLRNKTRCDSTGRWACDESYLSNISWAAAFMVLLSNCFGQVFYMACIIKQVFVVKSFSQDTLLPKFVPPSCHSSTK